MRTLTALTLSILIQFYTPAKSQTSAKEIVKKSINFHDSESQWNNKTIKIRLREQRPGSDDRITSLTINNRKGFFRLDQSREKHKIRYVIRGKKMNIRLDGQPPKDTTLIRRFRLYPERIKTIRNYYNFLNGLPMKIMDPGSKISPDFTNQVFNGISTFRVKVSYDPQVGNDIWYFYFAKKTYELVGYQFYHNEEKNDGEYIILEDAATIKKMKLPRKRNWYTNAGKEFLGSDIIVQ